MLTSKMFRPSSIMPMCLGNTKSQKYTSEANTFSSIKAQESPDVSVSIKEPDACPEKQNEVEYKPEEALETQVSLENQSNRNTSNEVIVELEKIHVNRNYQLQQFLCQKLLKVNQQLSKLRNGDSSSAFLTLSKEKRFLQWEIYGDGQVLNQKNSDGVVGLKDR